MQTLLPQKQDVEEGGSHRGCMSALLVYEDFATALRAKHSLDDLPCPQQSETGFCMTLWRDDPMSTHSFRE